MRQERAEPHGQFTGKDVFMARCCLNCNMDAIEAGRQNYTGFGVAALNSMQVIKNRPSWAALSSLK